MAHRLLPGIAAAAACGGVALLGIAFLEFATDCFPQALMFALASASMITISSVALATAAVLKAQAARIAALERNLAKHESGEGAEP
jgi:hypothetical protein